MAEFERWSDLAGTSLEGLEELDENAASDRDGRELTVGEVYVLSAVAEHEVEWVVAARDPAADSRILVVPADGGFLVGSQDLALEDSPLGELVVRCRFGTWIDGDLLKPELRAGVLALEDLSRVRQKWLDVGDGKSSEVVLAREVDDDPTYHDWIENVVAPARRALLEVAGASGHPGHSPGRGGPPERTPEVQPPSGSARPARSFRWAGALAAGILAVVALALLWRLNDRVIDLEQAHSEVEQAYRSEVTSLTSENGGLKTEVDLLTTERNALKAEQEHLLSQQERLTQALAEAGGAAREVERLNQQVADLYRRLGAVAQATVVIDPEVVVLDRPGRTTRSRIELLLRPGFSHRMVAIPLGATESAPMYRLEILNEEGQTVWVHDQELVAEPGELWFLIPTETLRKGHRELVLSELREETPVQIGRYLIEIES